MKVGGQKRIEGRKEDHFWGGRCIWGWKPWDPLEESGLHQTHMVSYGIGLPVPDTGGLRDTRCLRFLLWMRSRTCWPWVWVKNQESSRCLKNVYLLKNKSFVLWAGQYSKHFTNSNYFNSHNAHWAKYYYYSVLRVRKQGRKQLAPVETVSERLSEDSRPTRAPESMLLAPASCSCLSLWGAVWLCR